MNIQQLKGFVCVVKTRNITKAAQQLHMTQQALSKSLSKLEEEIGAPLLRRGERETVPTEVGRKILPVVESLIGKHEEHLHIMREIVAQNAHNIRIAFENSVLMNGFSSELLSRIGDINISSYLALDNDACIKDVKKKKATCAFAVKPPDLQGLCYFEVVKRSSVVIMSKKHYLAKKDVLTIEDLRNENHSWLSINSQTFHNYYQACMDAGFYPKITSEYPSAELQHQELPNGMEITIGGDFIFTENESKLVRRPLDCERCLVQAGFLYRPQDKDNSHLFSYFQVVKDYFDNR